MFCIPRLFQKYRRQQQFNPKIRKKENENRILKIELGRRKCEQDRSAGIERNGRVFENEERGSHRASRPTYRHTTAAFPVFSLSRHFFPPWLFDLFLITLIMMNQETNYFFSFHFFVFSKACFPSSSTRIFQNKTKEIGEVNKLELFFFCSFNSTGSYWTIRCVHTKQKKIKFDILLKKPEWNESNKTCCTIIIIICTAWEFEIGIEMNCHRVVGFGVSLFFFVGAKNWSKWGEITTIRLSLNIGIFL